ncbi:MAG: DUF4363 family protein [Clostridia bacterium]|nr:DUF4363 family protein [Clostridia bacterium]
MVKSIISIIISVLILVAGALYEQTVVLKQFNEFEATVTDLIKKSEEENITVEEVKNMQKDWRDKKRFLHIFIPHNEIKEVELWISEAISFAEYENYEELTDKLKVLKDLSKEIPKTFLIRPDNIL